MTKLLRLTGVALLALTIGVFGCDDDADPVAPTVTVPTTVTVTVPTTPPTTPPVVVTMTPPSQTIGVGGTVVFAVSVSGGAVGEAATWTCASSDPSLATVSDTPVGCQATAVAAGGVTITAVVTKGGETVNTAAGLTITEDMAALASVRIVSIKDSDEDDEVLSGKVTVTLSVDFGDQIPVQLSVLVDEVVAEILPFASAVPALQDEPAQQAAHPYELSFNAADYDLVTGEPAYMNGERTISAELMVASSDEPITSGFHAREFDNDDGYLVMADLGDNSARSDDGRQWYGGPDNGTIDITALPVSYSGRSVTSVSANFCGEDATDLDGADGYTFEFECEGYESNTDAEGVVGEMLALSSVGESGMILNAEDLPFPAFVDFAGPSAPTFSPNPNGREGGWVNLAVDFTGAQKTSNKNGWLNYNDDDAGVGGYNPVLRYAAVPSSGGGTGLDEAIAAPILTLANLPGESKKNAYCAVASAVDLLGNQSALPNAEDHATAAGTCMMAGVASDDDATPTAVVATYYMALLEAANAETPAEGAAENLANAGLMVGVDVTPPTVEFLLASLEDEATSIADGALWGLHVADRDGEMHSDPVDVGISVREAKTTTKFTESMAADPGADEFKVNSSVSLRHSVTFSRIREGYYTFSATAMDAAGNESAPMSRVALHDKTPPLAPGLFLVPGDDHASYSKTLILTDNLSVKSYSAALILPGVGELTLKTGMVDGYNAASPLTTSKTVQEAVNLPIVAVQDGTQPTPGAMPVALFKVYTYDQTGKFAHALDDLSVPTDAIPPVMFPAAGAGFKVEVTGGAAGAGVALKATAEVADAVGNLEATFSSVAFYATVMIDAGVHLRHIATVSGSVATTTLTETPSRNWIYEAKVSGADFLAAVDDAASYSGPVFALGMAGDGLTVYAESAMVSVSKPTP